jgi:hypothetical protein
MSSCILYHGPGAEGEALDEAHRIGHLLAPPFGEGGLKVADARKLVELLQIAPFDGIGVVVAGPMDQATYKANDALLKTIEEFDGEMVQPILWAHDLEDVSRTIRSRCLDRWVWLDPADEEPDEDSDEVEAAGRGLVQAVLSGDLWLIPDYVNAHTGKEHKLLSVAAGAIAANPTEPALRLWSRLRKVAKHRNPAPIEVVAAFLPEVK